MVCYNNLYSAISDVNYKVSESESKPPIQRKVG